MVWGFKCNHQQVSINFPFLASIEASTLIDEGYLHALLSSGEDLVPYWKGMLRDFPSHVVAERDPELRSSIGCTLYGVSVLI